MSIKILKNLPLWGCETAVADVPLLPVDVMREGLDASVSALVNRRGIQPTVIVHVGGHLGQELDEYSSLKPGQIVYCEPVPDVFLKLRDKASHYQNVTVVNLAISDRDGTTDFNVFEDTQQSSFFERGRVAPSSINRVVKVETARLDSLMAKLGPDISQKVSILVSDTQGAEMLVLEGAPSTLAKAELVVLEMSFFEMYRGASRGEDLVSVLEGHGFELVAADPFVWRPAWVSEQHCAFVDHVMMAPNDVLPRAFKKMRENVHRWPRLMQYVGRRRNSEYSGTPTPDCEGVILKQFEEYLEMLNSFGLAHTNLETNGYFVRRQAVKT